MRYLLDSHAIIWYFEDYSALSALAGKIIESSENRIFISVASLWEIAIKISISKLVLKRGFEQLLADVRNGDYEILQIEDAHLRKLASLPFIHKDPFDRLIVSTALAEGMTLITADENIHKYAVPWIW